MSKALQKAAALEASLKKQRLEEELLNDTFNTYPNDDNTAGGNAGYISLKKKSQNKKTKKVLDDVSDDDMAIDSSSQANRKISKFERCIFDAKG